MSKHNSGPSPSQLRRRAAKQERLYDKTVEIAEQHGVVFIQRGKRNVAHFVDWGGDRTRCMLPNSEFRTVTTTMRASQRRFCSWCVNNTYGLTEEDLAKTISGVNEILERR